MSSVICSPPGFALSMQPPESCCIGNPRLKIEQTLSSSMFASTTPKVTTSRESARPLHDYKIALADSDDDTFYDAEEELEHEFIEASENPDWLHRLDSPDQQVQALESLFHCFQRPEIDPETLSLMHPNGILGTMLTQKPEATKALLEVRLDALTKDTDNWWWKSSRTEARKDLADLRQYLSDGFYSTFLKRLKRFEDKHGKAPFQDILHARFAGYAEANRVGLSTLAPQTLPRSTTAELNALQKELKVAGQEDFNPLKVIDHFRGQNIPDLASWKDSKATFKHLLNSSAESIHHLLLAHYHHELLKAKRLIEEGHTGAEALLQTATDRLLKASSLKSPEAIRAWLAQPQQAALTRQLEKECATLCYQIRHEELMKLELPELSQEELSDLEQTINEVIATDTPMTFSREEQQLRINGLNRLKQALSLTRFMTVEKDEPLSERTYMLKAPSTAHLLNKLTQPEKDDETELYNKIHHYQVQMDAYRKKPNYSTIVACQQAAFDLRCAQEQLVMFETHKLIAEEPDACVLTTGSYKENTQLLVEMDKALQKTTPVRPLLNNDEAFLQLGIRHLWKDRPDICERLAELQHQHDLKICHYDFTTELKQFCQFVPEARNTLKDMAGDIVGPILEKVSAWQKELETQKETKKINQRKEQECIWEVFTASTDGYKKLEAAASDILRDTLEVAQRNPRMFRRMVGDSLQSFEQLKALIGYDSFSLLGQLQTRAKAESAASLFAGDQAIIEDFDYDNHPEDAARLRKFQLMVDMAQIAWQGTTTANAVKNMCTTTVSSQVAGLLGAAAMGICTLAPSGVWLGYKVGSYAGAALQTAYQLTGAVATRTCVNGLDGPSVRALNKLVNYGPMMALSRPPFDQLALIGRDVAQQYGMVRTFLSHMFRPHTFRLNRLTEAMNAVSQQEPGAWCQLAVEGAKCLAVISATALSIAPISLGIFYTAALAIGGTIFSPFISPIVFVGTVISTVQMSQSIGSFINNTEYLTSTTSAGMKTWRQHLLPEGSQEAVAVEQHCQKTAQKLVEKMSAQSPFKQFVRESVAVALAKKHWQKWVVLEQDEALVDSFSKGIEAELKETESARKTLAAELEKSIRAMKLLEEYQARTEELERNPILFEALQNGLKALGVIPPATSHGIAYYIQDQLTEIPMALTRQCGTEEPGVTGDDIYERLTEHHRNIIRGGYLINLATQGHRIKTSDNGLQLLALTRDDLLTMKNKVMEQVQNHLKQTTLNATRQRANLVLDKVLQDVVQIRDTITTAQLDDAQVRRQIGRSIENQRRAVESVEALRLRDFQEILRQNDLYQNMSDKQKKLIVDEAVPQISPV